MKNPMGSNSEQELVDGWNVQNAKGRILHVEITQGDWDHLDKAEGTCGRCDWKKEFNAGEDFTTKKSLNDRVRAHECGAEGLAKLEQAATLLKTAATLLKSIPFTELNFLDITSDEDMNADFTAAIADIQDHDGVIGDWTRTTSF